MATHAHSASPRNSQVFPPLASRPPSTPAPPLPHSSSTVSLPSPESMHTHLSSMTDLSSQLTRGPPVDPRRGFSPSVANTPWPLYLLSTDSLVLPVVKESARSCNSSTTLGSVLSSLESNSDISPAKAIQFDFPEPPPISPLLRRVKSSPLLTKDDVSIVQLGERAPHTAVLRFTRKQSPDVFSDIPSDSTSSPLADTALHAISQEHRLNTQPEYQVVLKSANWLSRPPASLPVPSRSGYIANDDDRSNVPPSLCHSSRLTTTPSATCPPFPRKASKMRSLKSSPSIESLDTRAEKRKIHNSIDRGRSAWMNIRKSYSMNFFCSPEAVARPRPRPSHGLHSPLMSNRTSQRATYVTSPAEWTKTSYLNYGALSRNATSKPLVQQTSTNTGYRMWNDLNRESEELKSFMDISPERRLGASKDAVKKLLRITSAILEWGRFKRSGKQ
ncbi:hypothetical protein E1B28_000782 [Marasmius oreades]|uniref:Uncharacterized protein n=1 Tax=Marasmius oreades TaxID=181124 RepID=A0A9P7V272_9AGAR|nr:uncharacterized protein E1B28_000782 [Marasmius oreades]KAG7098882.1 hypothetical protein E1B28_000782 [Marasmius oreades]